ncbi:MAG: aspartate 1-decarboxylase [Candidatus Njordarchaeales archaeon]
MLKKVLYAKIQGLRVTGKNIKYKGSITIDRSILKTAGIFPYECVLVANVSNGARFETYVIPGSDGEVILNGAAARLGEIGDELIVFSFAYIALDELNRIKPKIILINERNKIEKILHYNMECV